MSIYQYSFNIPIYNIKLLLNGLKEGHRDGELHIYFKQYLDYIVYIYIYSCTASHALHVQWSKEKRHKERYRKKKGAT